MTTDDTRSSAGQKSLSEEPPVEPRDDTPAPEPVELSADPVEEAAGEETPVERPADPPARRESGQQRGARGERGERGERAERGERGDRDERRERPERGERGRGDQERGERDQRERGGRDRQERDRTPTKPFLLETLGEAARSVDAKLRAQLVGTIVLNLTNSGEQYLYSWKADEEPVRALGANPGPLEPQPDCVISLSEDTLNRIRSGELNPQIGMLTDKIRIKGSSGLAIYFFNLFPGDRE